MQNDINPSNKGDSQTHSTPNRRNFQTPSHRVAVNDHPRTHAGNGSFRPNNDDILNDSELKKIPLPAIDEPQTPISKGTRWYQWRPSKKQALISGLAVLIIASGTVGALFYLKQPSKTVAVTNAPVVKPVHKPVAPPPLVSDLTGLPISNPAINQEPVTGVMIENTDWARPQSGLDQAGIVFEAIAEAGITRFLALYQGETPNYLGPVRSARPYFVQWCMTFDCALAHVGGSPQALTDINNWGVRNLDQFFNAGAYERVSYRFAPHNVYTSMAQLSTLEQQKGYGAVSFTSLPRKADSPSKNPNATTITINPSYYDFESQYTYNPASNNYTRSEAGAIQYQVNAQAVKTEITPKVIVAMVMQQGLAPDQYHTTYNVVGSGQVIVFQDGTVTTGTWSKAGNSAPIILTNNHNQPLRLNAGQTWFVAVGSSSDVTYQ